MADRLVIEDSKLAALIQQIARREHRSVEDVISSMLAQYQPQAGDDNSLPDGDELDRQVRLAAYQQARAYWQETGDAARGALTDQELDETFWLFDGDGIPRLKADQDKVSLPDSSLHQAGRVLLSAGFRSGQSDISARSRQILDDEYADYLL